MSKKPSLLISTIVVPVVQLFIPISPTKPDDSVISTNSKFPLFR